MTEGQRSVEAGAEAGLVLLCLRLASPSPPWAQLLQPSGVPGSPGLCLWHCRVHSPTSSPSAPQGPLYLVSPLAKGFCWPAQGQDVLLRLASVTCCCGCFSSSGPVPGGSLHKEGSAINKSPGNRAVSDKGNTRSFPIYLQIHHNLPQVFLIGTGNIIIVA